MIHVFLTINAAQIAYHAPNRIDVNSEFSKLHWVSFNEAKELDIAAITHVILEELENCITAGAYNHHPVPFIFERGGKFVREEV